MLQQFPALSGHPDATNKKTTHHQELPSNSGPYSYSDAVNKAAPAVVNIYTKTVVKTRPSLLKDNPVLEHLYRNRKIPQRQRIQSSLGSGVIMSQAGYIVTNNHVIQGADEVIVALQDGRETQAKIIGTDPDTDLAVLKIDLEHLPEISLSDSSNVEIGDVVLAIGNPFGIGQTVTQGIVSATGRHLLNLNNYEDFIQTDAAINLGNSGGALIDARGNLIGINTAIVSRSGGSQGIAFAIPTDLARRVMTSIVQHGEVVRGWLGIEGQSLSPSLARSFQLKDNNGVLVASVYRDSPAHSAGLQRGDVILAINGQNSNNARHVMTQVATLAPGENIQMAVLRGEDIHKFDLTVGKRPQRRQ